MFVIRICQIINMYLYRYKCIKYGKLNFNISSPDRLVIKYLNGYLHNFPFVVHLSVLLGYKVVDDTNIKYNNALNFVID